MTMDNDFNVAGDPLLAYGAQTAGYPKIALTDGTKTSLTAKHTLTASLPDGTTGPVSIYNIEDGLKVTSDATVTNVAGTPDVLQFQFTKKKVCNHIRVNETAHDLAAAVIEVSDNGTAWTPISAKNIDEHDTYWDLEFTNNTGYFYYRVTLADLTSIATSEVDIFLNDRTVKVESSPDFGNGDNAGEVKFYKAAISGFDGTVTDVAAAGWTQITGTSDLGQSATELAVIDNGLVRVALDKNVAGAQKSAHIFVFNGTAWVSFAFSENANTEYTITSVETNTSSETAVLVDFNDGAATSQGRVTLQRGIPTSKWDLLAYGDVGGQDFRWMWDDSQARTGKWTYFSNDGATFASDSYGQVAPESFSPTGTDNFMSVPLPASGINAVVAVNTDEGFAIDRIGLSGFNYQNLLAGDLPLSIWLGAVPMDYTAPATLDAEIGNTDGQLIEAESYYAWEGETPLIGTNLITTNADFESALGAEWLQTGTWATTTGQKKFGTASAEVTADGSLKQLYRTIGGLDIGATYALSGWVRSADAVGGDVEIKITGGGQTVSPTGREWEYITYLFAATATSHEVVLEVNTSVTSGNIQFDGIQLIKVKDADGTSALAFDTTSTTGWDFGADVQNQQVVDAPRGKAIQWESTGNARSITFEFDNADLSQYATLSAWCKSTISQTFTLALGASIVSNQSTVANEWTLLTWTLTKSALLDLTQIQSIRPSTTANGTHTIGAFRLSKHNPAIGQKHGILHDMGDSEGLVHWSKLNDRDVTWLDDVVAWEGETPLIGENLLAKTDGDTVSSGSFETTAAFNAWTQTSGTWTRVTDESKFGTASVEVAATGATKNLTQEYTSFESGATYALTGWVRSAESVAGGIRLSFANGAGDSNPSALATSADLAEGKEWTYLAVLWTATQTSAFLRCSVGADVTSGTVQFDGIQLIKVKNADGTSALAFDTTSTDGWTTPGTIDGIVDAPRGSAIKFTGGNGTGSNNELTLTFDTPQDLSAYQHLSLWGKRDGSPTVTAIQFYDGTATSALISFNGVQGEWSFLSEPMSSFTGVDLTSITEMRFRVTSDTSRIGPIKLSKHDPSIGAKHGILHDMGDAEGLAFWWKGVEEQDVLQEDFQIDATTLNGNFEAGTGATFTNWSNEGTPTLAEETSTQFAGTRSAKITASGAANEGLKQSFTATKAATYKVSAYAKATSGDTARLRIRNVTDATNPVDTTTTSTSWTRLSGSFTTVAGKVYEIQVLASADTDIVWFDDVELDVNLVVNPGFETYTTTPGVPDSWSINGGASSQFTKETTVVRTGTNALKITAAGGIGGSILQGFTTTAGKSYLVEAWGRTGGATGKPQLILRNNTDGGAVVASPSGTVGGTTWEKLTFTFFSDGGDTYEVRLNNNTTTNGDITYFDDISVKEIVATDASGEDNHGTLRGATNTAGPTPGAADPFGGTGAVEFDGVDDYIEVADDAALDVTTAITLEAWVNADAFGHGGGGNSPRIISKASSYQLMGTAGLDFQTILRISGGDVTVATPSVGLSTGVDYHVAVTYDGANIRIYLDGALVKTQAQTGTIDTSASPIIIGNFDAGVTARYWDGSICGVRVYNRALGADEVAQRYNTRTHEAVAGWVGVDANDTLILSAIAAEGTKSMRIGASTGSIGAKLVFPNPQDLSPYTYLAVSHNRDTGTGASVSLVDASGTTSSTSLLPGAVGAWRRDLVDLSALTGVDLTQITEVKFTSPAGDAANLLVDGLKLTSFAETGDWVYAVEADADDGYIITNTGGTTTPASGDTYEVELYAPHPGDYDVSFFARAASGTPNLDVSIDGGSAISEAIASTAWSSQVAGDVNTVGPFTLSEGTHTVQFTTTSAVAVELTPRIALHESSLAYDGGSSDASGEGNDGTANDSGLMPLLRAAPDPFGGMGALAFDGVDDYIEMSIPNLTERTIEGWLYANSLDGSLGVSVLAGQGGSYLGVRGNGSLLFTWNNPGQKAVEEEGSVATGQWYHLVGTHDGTTARIYLNGREVNDRVEGIIEDTNSSFRIGDSNTFGGNLDGRIAGVRVYNRALGADEVAQRYNAGTHEAVAGWAPIVATDTIALSTDAAEGTKAITATLTGPLVYTFPSPQDLTNLRYLSVHAKRSSGSSYGIELRDASGGIHEADGDNATTVYSRDTFDLSLYTSVDLTQVSEIRVKQGASGAVWHLDGLKLTSLEEVGDWRFTANTGASGGYAAQTGFTPSTTTLAAGDAITQPVVVPAAGDYYVGVMMQSTGGGGFAECSVAGVDSGTPQAIPTGSLATQENQVLFGPFTLTAGQKDVKIRVSTLGSMTTFVVDFIAIYPYQATTGTDIFPKDFSNSMLKDVNKIGSS